MMTRITITLCGLLFAFTSTLWASQYKTIKDWDVTCSDNLNCTMEIYQDGGDVNSFGFMRGTTASAPLILLLAVDGELAKDAAISIELPGQSVSFTLAVASGKFDGSLWTFPIAFDQQKLISALKAGKSIEVSASTLKGKIHATLSLAGVIASMLFIDEVQGRVGNRDALHARGEGPAVAVKTRVVELTSQSELPKQVRNVWAADFNECADEEEDVVGKYGGLRVDLDVEGSLFLLPCGFAGAYNLPYIAIVREHTNGNARIAAFPVIGNMGPTIVETAYNINWNDKKSQLDAFFRGRGIGDCGSKHLWQWNGDGEYGQFELVEERMKDDCDEKFDNFPLIWPPD